MERSAGTVLYRGGKFLLLKYPQKNYWGLAKGRIEKGESEEEAALREAREETGLVNIRMVPGFKTETKYYFTRKRKAILKKVVWFLGEVLDEGDGVISHEHEDLCWVDYEKGMDLLLYKADQGVLELAYKFLKA